MTDPCKPEACNIQSCLERTRYNEEKCTKFIDKLYLCCKKYYEENGPEQTTCCPKYNLLQLKLRQRGLEEANDETVQSKKLS